MKSLVAFSLGFQITLAARLYRTRLARALSEAGLFPGQEQVLRALGEAPGGLRMGDLARVLQVRPPTLTKTIQRLQSRRLIARALIAGDARIVHLKLSKAGEAALSKVITAEDALEAELSALFKAKSGARLRKGLRRVIHHLSPSNDTSDNVTSDTVIQSGNAANAVLAPAEEAADRKD